MSYNQREDIEEIFNSRKNNFANHADVQTKLIYGDEHSDIPIMTIAIPTLRGGKYFESALRSAANQNVSKEIYEILVEMAK